MGGDGGDWWGVWLSLRWNSSCIRWPQEPATDEEDVGSVPPLGRKCRWAICWSLRFRLREGVVEGVGIGVVGWVARLNCLIRRWCSLWAVADADERRGGTTVGCCWWWWLVAGASAPEGCAEGTAARLGSTEALGPERARSGPICLVGPGRHMPMAVGKIWDGWGMDRRSIGRARSGDGAGRAGGSAFGAGCSVGPCGRVLCSEFNVRTPRRII